MNDSPKYLKAEDVLAAIRDLVAGGQFRTPSAALFAVHEAVRALPPANPGVEVEALRCPSWLDETAAIIRCDGPNGMDRQYCDMVATNLERLADSLRARTALGDKPDD